MNLARKIATEKVTQIIVNTENKWKCQLEKPYVKDKIFSSS